MVRSEYPVAIAAEYSEWLSVLSITRLFFSIFFLVITHAIYFLGYNHDFFLGYNHDGYNFFFWL